MKNQIKQTGIAIMTIGLGITIFMILLLFSNNYEAFMNHFLLSIYKTHQLNLAPMIGITIMAIGEFILWESMYSNNWDDFQIKFFINFRLIISRFRVVVKHLTTIGFRNLVLLKMFVLFFKS
jgi:hypothetical protein